VLTHRPWDRRLQARSVPSIAPSGRKPAMTPQRISPPSVPGKATDVGIDRPDFKSRASPIFKLGEKQFGGPLGSALTARPTRRGRIRSGRAVHAPFHFPAAAGASHSFCCRAATSPRPRARDVAAGPSLSPPALLGHPSSPGSNREQFYREAIAPNPVAARQACPVHDVRLVRTREVSASFCRPRPGPRHRPADRWACLVAALRAARAAGPPLAAAQRQRPALQARTSPAVRSSSPVKPALKQAPSTEPFAETGRARAPHRN